MTKNGKILLELFVGILESLVSYGFIYCVMKYAFRMPNAVIVVILIPTVIVTLPVLAYRRYRTYSIWIKYKEHKNGLDVEKAFQIIKLSLYATFIFILTTYGIYLIIYGINNIAGILLTGSGSVLSFLLWKKLLLFLKKTG